ncbi:MAG TPA: ribonuclease D [Gemmatimonas aurantiaca]|uniref:Ribonuclease D n=2 Tax=Gemmatimonas aurantiaca TaxID=173480 RepID=A0A3D4VB09_9BACT|nr:HRDC domain-containing protein [Gemmatimonas aurantiaca]BAH40060.1 putative ribonuclease [Gemmatimonas aurantiaca T-27]HCT57932.1 ribonuclease D [Gemmatimonas aurantiaca]
MPAQAPHYLDTVETVDTFLAGLNGVRAIALDTEGASFHRFVDRIYLLQLSTADHEAVIDPLPIGTPTRLGVLLEDPQVEVVLHDADYDLRLLRQDYGWRVTHLFDTRVAAQLLGIRAFGLAALLEQFFGIKLDKKHQRADWSMRPLTADMLDYAAHDTRHLLGLRDRLHDELVQKGRWSWAQEEFTRAEGTRWEPEAPDTSFLRLKGARDLNRRELARLRELVRWRDGIAAELDRATFRVAGNEVLLDLARQAPATRDALFAVKGFPRGMSESRAQEALQSIVRGNAVPDAELPRFPKATRWDREPDFDERVARLKTVRDAAATDLNLDPGVLCSRDRMEAVVRRKPRHVDDLAELPELRRWQVEVLGPAFVKALASYAGDDSPYKPG